MAIIAIPLEKMSHKEKLQAMEAIWADLTQDEDRLESPAWHAEALREAEQLAKEGKARFSDWEQAKKRVRRKRERNS